MSKNLIGYQNHETEMTAHAQMKNGSLYGMSDEQE